MFYFNASGNSVKLSVEHGLRKPRINRQIVLEDLNFLWDRPELRELVQMWNKKFSVLQMAEYFERDPDEILLALIHLARTDRIKKRKGGLFG
jgi:hypothetical protein